MLSVKTCELPLGMVARWGHSRFEFHSSNFLQCKSHISPVQISHFSSSNLSNAHQRQCASSTCTPTYSCTVPSSVCIKFWECYHRVVASAGAWDTARPIDTLLLSRRVHVPYAMILCFLLLVHGITLSLRQLKMVLCELGLKRRVARYSVRHLQQVEELIRVGCSKIFCSSSYRFYSDEDLDVLVCCRWSFMDSLVVGQCVTD